MATFYRRLPKFEYAKPGSLDEALNLLGTSDNGRCRVYAGGTDLIPKLKLRLIHAPGVLIDLKGIPDLDYVRYDEKNGLRIGALASIYSVANSPLVREKFPVLAQAANSIASIQVQNRGTIVGNICNAVPSADSAPALLCLDAKVLCVSKGGERTVRMEDFFTGPNRTILNSGEIVKEIQIPRMPENSKGVYMKLSPRSRMDLAVVGVAAVVVSENRSFKDVRIGLGAVAPTPMRALKAESLLRAGRANDEGIIKAAASAALESRPIDDHRASAEYRKTMVEVLVKRAIDRTLSN